MSSVEWSSGKTNMVTSAANISDEKFRAWASDVDSHLVAAGLARETISLAAQADLTTALCPAPNTYGVFKVYELNDSMSGDSPIYIKIAFGGVHGSTNYPGLAAYAQGFVQIGTTVDASGTLGGLATSVFNFALNSTSTSVLNGDDSISTQNYITKQDGVLIVIIGGGKINGQVNRPIITFALERVPDENGSLTPDGFSVVKNTAQAVFSGVYYPSAPLSLTMTAENPFPVWVSNPAAIIGSSLAASADGAIQFQRFYHVTPKILPMRSLMAYYAGSLAEKSTAVVNIDAGGPRRYLAVGGTELANNCGFLVDSTDSSYNTAILWE